MRPCTAVGVLFLIYQLLDVSALYDDSEVNKREAGRFLSHVLLHFFFLFVIQKFTHSQAFTVANNSSSWLGPFGFFKISNSIASVTSDRYRMQFLRSITV